MDNLEKLGKSAVEQGMPDIDLEDKEYQAKYKSLKSEIDKLRSKEQSYYEAMMRLRPQPYERPNSRLDRLYYENQNKYYGLMSKIDKLESNLDKITNEWKNWRDSIYPAIKRENILESNEAYAVIKTEAPYGAKSFTVVDDRATASRVAKIKNKRLEDDDRHIYIYRKMDETNSQKYNIPVNEGVNKMSIVDEILNLDSKSYLREKPARENYAEARPNSNRLLEMLDDYLDGKTLAEELINWMSDDEVGRFAKEYGYFPDGPEEVDEIIAEEAVEAESAGQGGTLLKFKQTSDFEGVDLTNALCDCLISFGIEYHSANKNGGLYSVYILGEEDKIRDAKIAIENCGFFDSWAPLEEGTETVEPIEETQSLDEKEGKPTKSATEKKSVCEGSVRTPEEIWDEISAKEKDWRMSIAKRGLKEGVPSLTREVPGKEVWGRVEEFEGKYFVGFNISSGMVKNNPGLLELYESHSESAHLFNSIRELVNYFEGLGLGLKFYASTGGIIMVKEGENPIRGSSTESFDPLEREMFEAMNRNSITDFQASVSDSISRIGSLGTIQLLLDSELADSFQDELFFIKNTYDLSDTQLVSQAILDAGETLLEDGELERAIEILKNSSEEENEEEFGEYEEPEDWPEVDQVEEGEAEEPVEGEEEETVEEEIPEEEETI